MYVAIPQLPGLRLRVVRGFIINFNGLSGGRPGNDLQVGCGKFAVRGGGVPSESRVPLKSTRPAIPAEGSMKPVDLRSKFLTSRLAFKGVAALSCEFSGPALPVSLMRAVARGRGGEFKRELGRIGQVRGFDVHLIVRVRPGVRARITDDDGPVLEGETADRKVGAGAAARARRAGVCCFRSGYLR